MTGFKEGDRVRIVYPEGGPAWHDRPGIVIEVRPGRLFAYVVKLDHPTAITQGGFSESQLRAAVRTEPEPEDVGHDPADVPWGRIAQGDENG